MKIHPKIYQQITPTTQQPDDADVPKTLKKQIVFYCFCYVGHVMLGQKINKNKSNILHNTTVTTMLQLDSILEATWPHFGMVLGVKMGPKSLQNQS